MEREPASRGVPEGVGSFRVERFQRYDTIRSFEYTSGSIWENLHRAESLIINMECPFKDFRGSPAPECWFDGIELTGQEAALRVVVYTTCNNSADSQEEEWE